MKLTKKNILAFQKEILQWYGKNKRDLPWRHSQDPYNILISEVMAQQTQLSRVIPKYLLWMETFPTLQVLAKASTRDILTLWSGLGYNRRALYLKRLAEEVVKNNNGVFSQDEKELRQLPGVGEYTARALLCFAFNKQVAVVDTNVRKVILLKFLNRHPEFISGSKSGSKKKEVRRKSWEMLKYPSEYSLPRSSAVQNDKVIQEIADKLLPKGKAYEWNQALMDYAAAELKKEKISIPKQSKFKGSDRYYRGQILKILLGKEQVSKKELRSRFKGQIRGKRLDKIIDSLKKDKMLKEKENIYTLFSETVGG